MAPPVSAVSRGTVRSRAAEGRGDAAAVEDQRPMAHAGNLLEVGRDQQHAPALLKGLPQQPVDFGFGPHIDAEGRLLEDQQLGPRLDPPRQHHLLLISPAEVDDRDFRLARPHAEPVEDALRAAPLAAAAQKPVASGAGGRVHEEVLAHREIGREALLAALARDEPDALGHGLGRGARRQLSTAEGDAPLAPLEIAEERPPDGVMASPAQPDKPKNLAGVQGEADRAGTGGDEPVDLEKGGGRGRRRGAEQLLQRPADDQLDQPARRRGAHRLAAHAPPVPEHGDAVGDAKHLVQAVADIEDAEAAPAQAPQGGQETGDIGLGEGRGRLVQDQHVGLDRERPGDADERALGGAQPAHPGIRVDPAAERRQGLLRRLARRPPGDQPMAAPIAGLHGHVLGHRQAVDQTEILVDEAQRQPLGPEVDRRPRTRTSPASAR